MTLVEWIVWIVMGLIASFAVLVVVLQMAKVWGYGTARGRYNFEQERKRKEKKDGAS